MNPERLIGRDVAAWFRTALVIAGGVFVGGMIWKTTLDNIDANAGDIRELRADYEKMQDQVSQVQSGVEALTRKFEVEEEAARLYKERLREEERRRWQPIERRDG